MFDIAEFLSSLRDYLCHVVLSRSISVGKDFLVGEQVLVPPFKPLGFRSVLFLLSVGTEQVHPLEHVLVCKVVITLELVDVEVVIGGACRGVPDRNVQIDV